MSHLQKENNEQCSEVNLTYGQTSYMELFYENNLGLKLKLINYFPKTTLLQTFDTVLSKSALKILTPLRPGNLLGSFPTCP